MRWGKGVQLPLRDVKSRREHLVRCAVEDAQVTDGEQS